MAEEEEAKAKGNAAFSQQKFSEAIDFYTQAIKLSPQNHLLYSNRSIAYSSLHDFPNALSDAQITIQLNPTFSKAYLRLSDAHIGLKNYQKAVSALKNGLKVDPNNRFLETSLAKAKSMLPRYRSSMGMLSKVLVESVMEDILTRLPVKSLVRFKCVNKTWFSLISDVKFVKNHVERSFTKLMLKETVIETIDNEYKVSTYFRKNAFTSLSIHEEGVKIESRLSDFLEADDMYDLLVKRRVDMIGTCDGLLCFNSIRNYMRPSSKGNIVCLFNPTTRVFKRLPPTPFPSKPNASVSVCFGFGYDASIQDYKVVCIVYLDERGAKVVSKPRVYVYTLGLSETWRMIENFPCHSLSSCYSSGVFLNGAIHWVAKLNGRSRSIVVFDLADEKFTEVALPCCRSEILGMQLATLGGGYLHLLREFDIDDIEIWEMKDYGVEKSWTKLFTIPEAVTSSSSLIVPLCFSKTGEILLRRLHNHGPSPYLSKTSADLVMYDPKEGKTRYLKVHGIPNDFAAYTYAESLVSLKLDEYVGEEGKKTEDDNWKAELCNAHPIGLLWKVGPLIQLQLFKGMLDAKEKGRASVVTRGENENKQSTSAFSCSEEKRIVKQRQNFVTPNLKKPTFSDLKWRPQGCIPN